MLLFTFFMSTKKLIENQLPQYIEHCNTIPLFVLLHLYPATTIFLSEEGNGDNHGRM